ncbi:SUN domain-containing protein 1-like [Copidosoma floridanum]|uniref:SUN domain-containing protein 1-like n=1 Tax=Copidosoma floridanum TaxID=29053 RepID=UPI000C6F5AA1|nr:SUN domain-containing protein 1-like [Copidosoma floridanum]
MEQLVEEKHQNHPMMVLETLVIFDIWLMIKTRWFIIKFIEFITPIVKVMFFMTLGAILLLTYVFAYGKFDIDQKVGFHPACKKYQPAVGKYLEIGDDSRSEAITPLRKELIRIKSESRNLKKTLYQMNNQLTNLYNRRSNLADFASEAVGGLVVDTPDTHSYTKPESNQVTIFGIPLWKVNHYTPRKVIQPWVEPGQCWSFRGSHGKIEIELAHPAIIERVTLEHIPASASLTGSIDEAPKAFNVLGKLEDEYITIGSFTYSNTGLPSQIFEIKKPNIKTAFKRVILEILSNWGNLEYTCVYRFKVHGKMYINNLDKV